MECASAFFHAAILSVLRSLFSVPCVPACRVVVPRAILLLYAVDPACFVQGKARPIAAGSAARKATVLRTGSICDTPPLKGSCRET